MTAADRYEEVPVVALDETGSTNTDAMALALGGKPVPFWVTAKRQTAGRGRSGRGWTSIAGNLHASLALRLDCAAETAPQLSLVAGVAVADALSALAQSDPHADISGVRLKWPNDVMAGGAKLGGILIETTRQPGGSGLLAVIGFGLNVVSSPGLPGQAAADLASLGLQTTADNVRAALGRSTEDALVLWRNGSNFAAIRERWLKAGIAHGTAITVNSSEGRLCGMFAGLDADGALLLQDERGGLRRVTYGDVMLTGPSPS